MLDSDDGCWFSSRHLEGLTIQLEYFDCLMVGYYTVTHLQRTVQDKTFKGENIYVFHDCLLYNECFCESMAVSIDIICIQACCFEAFPTNEHFSL